MNHLVLFFDINGTIIALDTAQEKSIEVTLLQELSKRYIARWHESIPEPITYTKFVKQYLLQGDEKVDLELKRQRQQKYAEFLTYLERNNKEIYDRVLVDFIKLREILFHSKGHLFPSFLHLLEKLKKSSVPYTLVLRTFGDDIPMIVEELANHSIFISQTGYFKEKTLYRAGKAETDSAAILSSLKPGVHQAWKDDWNYWHANKHKSFFGKPFYFAQQKPRTLFFDDKALEKDIIYIQKVDGMQIDRYEAINAGYLIPVDTLKAIREVNYFLERVERFF